MVCIISGVGRFPHFARICCLMTLYAKEHQVDGFIRWLVWHVWKKCLSISKKPEGVLSKKNTEKNAQLSKETFRNLAKKQLESNFFFPEEIQDRVSMFLFASPFFCCEKCCVLKKKWNFNFFRKLPVEVQTSFIWVLKTHDFFTCPMTPSGSWCCSPHERGGKPNPVWEWGGVGKCPKSDPGFHSGDQQTWGVYLKDQRVLPARTVSFWR